MSGKTRWIGLGAISLAISLIIMDGTIVSVAIPSIVKELGINSTEVQWIQEIYTLLFASLLLIWGRVADRFGSKRILVIGIILFIVSSVACALAPSGVSLIAFRAIQGIGGAMILPTTLSLVNYNFRGKERAIAFAVWGATIGGMAAIGPLVGGYLSEHASWRWAFGVNIPFGIIALIGVVLFTTETVARKLSSTTDILGAVLSIAGLGLFVFALIEGRNYGWWLAETDAEFSFGALSIIPVIFALAAVIIVAFVFWERHRAKIGNPGILDLSLFGISSFANGNVTALVVSLGEFGLILSLPLWFQNVAGLSPFEAGLGLLPLALGSFIASGSISALSKRISGLTMVRIGLVLEIIGLACIAIFIRPDSTAWTTAPFLFIYGIGVGFATAQLTSVILIDVPMDRSGQASGTQSTSRQLGSAMGIAILGTILFSTLKSGTEQRLAEEIAANPQVQTLVDSIDQSSGGAIAQLAANPATQPIAQAASDAMTQGVALAAVAGTIALIIGFITSLRIKSAKADHPLSREDDKTSVSAASTTAE